MKTKILARMEPGRWYTTKEITFLLNSGNRGGWDYKFVKIWLQELAAVGSVHHKTNGKGDKWVLADSVSTLPA